MTVAYAFRILHFRLPEIKPACCMNKNGSLRRCPRWLCAVPGVYKHFRYRFSSASDVDPSAVSACKKNIPRKRTVVCLQSPYRRHDGRHLLLDEEVDRSRPGQDQPRRSIVRKGEPLAKVNDKLLLAQLSRYEAQLAG